MKTAVTVINTIQTGMDNWKDVRTTKTFNDNSTIRDIKTWINEQFKSEKIVHEIGLASVDISDVLDDESILPQHRDMVEKFLCIENTKFKLRYADYTEGAYTVPVLLTRERAEKFLNDFSVTEVVFIDQNGTQVSMMMK